MSEHVPTWHHGPVTVYFGAKSGKYPDGNQVVVRGSDSTAVFDTPQVANRIGAVLDTADIAILSHVHEDHMAGLHRLARAEVHVHAADVEAARSWEGLCRHYGYEPAQLQALKAKIEAEFHYVSRPDAVAYVEGRTWDLGGVRVRAVHLPGHTAGHSALLIEPHGIAFIGDIDLTGFGPYYGDASSSLSAFRESIARLAQLPVPRCGSPRTTRASSPIGLRSTKHSAATLRGSTSESSACSRCWTMGRRRWISLLGAACCTRPTSTRCGSSSPSVARSSSTCWNCVPKRG